MRSATNALAIALALLVAGCGVSSGAPPHASPNASPGATSPRGPASPAESPGESLDPSLVPPGRIAFMRVDADKIERYFTVDSLGGDVHALYETRACACIRWSTDGTQIWTVTETETGLRYTTMDPDGGNVVVHMPAIETLNLAPGFGSADGQRVGFFGWDDTDPARLGLWVGETDLTELHQVTAVPAGVLSVDPIGMSGDGSHVYFHGDVGPSTENDFHHAGNVYVIATNGSGLRQLNPDGTKTEITGTGLSADGGRLAFTAWQEGSAAEGNALFVVEGPDGVAEQVTEWTPGLWGAAWAPTGDRIALTQSFGSDPIASLIKPDGTGLRAISPDGSAGSAFGPVWAAGGEHFLVRRGAFHRNDLWIMDLEGRFVWQVTDKPASYDIYAWRPDPTG